MHLSPQLEAVLECIAKYGLVENARITGDFLLAGLHELAVRLFPASPHLVKHTHKHTHTSLEAGVCMIPTGRWTLFGKLGLSMGFSVSFASSREQTKYPQAIANVRGQGTLVAFDAADAAAQGAIIAELRTRGVDIPPCGQRAVRCRPGLFFGPSHAAQFLCALEESVKSLQVNDAR